jgi:hypothetical protein
MEHSEAYTFEDYRDGMPPRAFGSETEFTNDKNSSRLFTQVKDNGVSLDKKYLYRLASYADPEHFVSTGRDLRESAIFSTGGELYIDVGMYEYATPECTSPNEVVAHERAGETVLLDTLARIDEQHRHETKTNLYKRSGYTEIRVCNEIRKAASIGHHENYTSINKFSSFKGTSSIDALEKSIDACYLADFLALRKLIDGTGMVAQDHFSITQKPDAINFRQFTSATDHGQKRPFYQHNTRLEIRSGEGNKSDWATEFKYGLTSLVIRLIEHDKYPKHLLLKDPNHALLSLSKDPFAEVELHYGGTMRAIDVLKAIVETAYDLGQNYAEFPAYEKKAAGDFQKFYDDLRNISLPDHNVTALSDRIDWAARYQYLIDEGLTYETISASKLRQVRYDLLWDKLGENDLARLHFRKFGHTALVAPIPKVPHTRAESRTKIAGQLYKDGSLRAVAWYAVQAYGSERYHFPNVLSTDFIKSTGTERLDKKSSVFRIGE